MSEVVLSRSDRDVMFSLGLNSFIYGYG
jgi:hypothetical protein